MKSPSLTPRDASKLMMLAIHVTQVRTKTSNSTNLLRHLAQQQGMSPEEYRYDTVTARRAATHIKRSGTSTSSTRLKSAYEIYRDGLRRATRNTPSVQ